MVWRDHIPDDISNLYEIYDFKLVRQFLLRNFVRNFRKFVLH